jgi:glycosyltransferase involved in cell wall biosynthesis
MRILYDYSAFVMQARGGVSRVLYELFRHIAEKPGVECKMFAGFHRNLYLRDAPALAKRRIIGWYLPEWVVKHRIFMPINRFLFRFVAKSFRPDVCHLTYFDTPKVPKGCKVIVTVHDMIHELYADMFGPNDPQHDWKLKAVDNADGVICVSENTKRDLGRFLNIEGKLVAVVYHGNSLSSVKPRRITYPYEYFLYVGTRSAFYKNFDLVLRAFSMCMNQISAHLVCFGGGEFAAEEVKRIDELHLDGLVHQVGGDDEALAGHYAGAKALIYPSKYEGFGLPPVEAMGLYCPVISSDAPPMPEVIGDAAQYFSPEDASSLCESMMAAYDNDKRQALLTRAYERSKEYSWDSVSDVALRFYREVAAERGTSSKL